MVSSSGIADATNPAAAACLHTQTCTIVILQVPRKSKGMYIADHSGRGFLPFSKLGVSTADSDTLSPDCPGRPKEQTETFPVSVL